MKKRLTRKSRLLIVVAVCAVLLIGIISAVFGGGNFLVNYAIGRSGDGGNRQVALEVDKNAVQQTQTEKDKNDEAQAELTKQFYENHPEEAVSITSSDGLTLVGGCWQQTEGHKWAIVIHGYRGSHVGMIGKAQRFYDAGYSVLAPDLRGCGKSGGDFVGMGWPDRLDILEWIDWICARDPQAHIVLYGVSMGAATVMMTSGENTPDAVVAFVEDCGYTSVWDIFASELKLRFDLPQFPLMNAASLIARTRAGYDFKNTSALEQVAKCEKPMLFIHGDQDDFVPYSMLQPLYDAKPGTNKQMITAQGAGHGRAVSVMGEAYWQAVFAFLDPYVGS